MGIFGSLFGKKKEEEKPEGGRSEEKKGELPEAKDKLEDVINMLKSMKSREMQTVCTQLVTEEAARMLLELYRQKPGGFLADEEAAEPVREIGERVNEAGGMDLMLETHKVFAAKCDEIGPGLARNLEMAWDGIGEWRG